MVKNESGLSARAELGRRNEQTKLVLGGLALAGLIGQVIFKPKWTRRDLLEIVAVPVMRTAFEEWQLRKRQRVELPADSPIVRAYEAAYASSGLAQKPELVVLQDRRANAMAIGTLGPAKIVVLGNLSRKLDEAEMEAVFAHELAHIASGDLWLACAVTVGAMVVQKTVLSPVVQQLSQGNPLVGLLAGLLTQGVFMRLVVRYMQNREAAADARAAMTTGRPKELARALVDLGATAERKIKGWRRFIPDTHPKGWIRVGRLMRMGA